MVSLPWWTLPAAVTLLVALFVVVHGGSRRVGARRDYTYRVLFDAAKDAIFLMKDGRFVDCNPETLRMFGVTRGEILGRSPAEFSPPFQGEGRPSSEKASAMIETALAGTPLLFEWQHTRADGTPFDAEVSLTRLGPGGGTADLLAIVRDVTTRRAAENALRVSEEKFSRVFMSAPAGISLSRMDDGRLLEVNREFERLFGFSRDEIIGRTSFELGIWVNPEDRRRHIERVATGTLVEDAELTLRARTGNLLVLRSNALAVELGGEMLLLSAFVDITEQKRAEEALRQSEARYRALVENTPDIIARFDRDRRYLFINGAVRGNTSIPPANFPGRTLWEVGFTPEQASERDELLRRVVETGQEVEAELAFDTPSWRRVYEWRAFPEFDASGRVESVLTISRDITQRRQAEENLRASMAQLHALTRRMEQVREDERKAISHEVHDELGQVLTALRMDLMAIRDMVPRGVDVLGEKVRSSLELTDSATAIVQDIAARLRPGMLDYLGLRAAVDWQVEDFQKRSGVACTLTLPSGEPEIDGDRSTALFRILQESLTNVARHARAAHVHVMLAETPREVRMSVADDGIGIPRERAEDPASLGLVGMRERLHPFGGICTIESPAAGGTCVTVILPKS